MPKTNASPAENIFATVGDPRLPVVCVEIPRYYPTMPHRSCSAHAIWWIRRDLRLHDNPALCEAARRGPVVPVFILDPAILNSRLHKGAQKRKSFLYGGLRQLESDLRAKGSRLIIRSGKPEEVLSNLLAETGATAIWCQEDYSPYARRRDSQVKQVLPLHLAPGVTVHNPADVLKTDGKPYSVFTPFSRAWLARGIPQRAILAAPGHIRTPESIASEPLPHADTTLSLVPGEREARRRWKDFASGPLFEYGMMRNRLDSQGTSTLSPYFRFGMLSAYEAAVTVRAAALSAPDAESRKSAEAWLNELIWRDFFISVLYHFPQVAEGPFNQAFHGIRWRKNASDLSSWQEGLTGYPIVDAGMRQLRATGWIHNRTRMIVGSFQVKDLLMDWKEGELWFMRSLIDGDPAANNGGWQWVAGVGTDAAPYFRIFNPVLQGKKYDPEGNYVRHWVPELAGLPSKYIHCPWEAPREILSTAGVGFGKTYPRRIVDHVMARERALVVLAGTTK